MKQIVNSKPTKKQRFKADTPTKEKIAPSSKSSENTTKNSSNSTILKVLWFSILCLMLLVFLKPISDSNTEPKVESNTELTFATFISGKYQKSIESDLLSDPFFVNLKKSKNEYEYNLFGKVNLSECYSGKDGYIFGESMTKASFGDDFIGLTEIKNEVAKAKFVQTKLSELGIQLLILFAPGKSTIYSEFLPDKVAATKMKTKNSTTYISECQLQGVNHIDFIRYFTQIKPLTEFPLFTQYGSHWSYFGECIAVDTTINRMEKLLSTNLPNLRFGQIQFMDTALVRDADIFRKIPMHKMPKGKPLAYPQQLGYDQSDGAVPQKILAIGDSYFRGFFYLGAMDAAFGGSQQWYYNNSIVPESPDNPEVWQLDLKSEILKTKAVVILCNEMNLKNLGNGFIDQAYLLFSNEAQYAVFNKNRFKLNTIKRAIRENSDLMEKLTIESHSRGLTLDSLINETAINKKEKLHM